MRIAMLTGNVIVSRQMPAPHVRFTIMEEG
jgi:hypothetical protein